MAGGLKKHKEAMLNLKGMTVEAGWFETAKYPDGQSVVQVAKWNEFGTSKEVTNEAGEKEKVTRNPPRPFMRLARANIVKNLPEVSAKLTQQVIKENLSVVQALAQVGKAMENEIRKSIKNGGWEKNADATIEKKGFDKPLIDTSYMLQSVSSKIK